MGRIPFHCLTLVVALATLSPPVHACLCIGTPYPGDRFEKSAATFVGTVLEKRLVKEEQSSRLEVVLDVLRSWKGPSPGEPIVITSSTGSCEYPFETGKTYLVFVNEHSSSGLCSGNLLLEDAGQEVRYLNALQAGQLTGTIFGTVSFDWTEDREGHAVVVEGPDGFQHETATDSSGQFSVRGLSPGRHVIRVPISEEFNPDPAEVAIELRHESDAAIVGVASRRGGRIQLRVLDAAGVPAGGLGVFLPGHSRQLRTDDEGRIVVSRLPPGNHVIGVKFARREGRYYDAWVHPGAWTGKGGKPVRLEAGEVLDLPDLVLPFRLERCTVDVVVRLPGGTPVEGAKVSLSDRGNLAEAYSDQEGRVAFEIYKDFNYRVSAQLVENEVMTHTGLTGFEPLCPPYQVDLDLQKREQPLSPP